MYICIRIEMHMYIYLSGIKHLYTLFRMALPSDSVYLGSEPPLPAVWQYIYIYINAGVTGRPRRSAI